jgi:hypothetical protein
LSRPDGLVQNSSQTRGTVTISYDASSKSYTVKAAGGSQTFGSPDAQPKRWDGEQIYAKSEGSSSDYLTLVTNPYTDPQYSNKYVGMGYWQHNVLGSSGQQTEFTTFTYGFATPGSGVPRTGTAHWLADIFGMLTIPGEELRIIQGLGDFDVDFAAGAFRANANVDESTVVNQGGNSGSLRFQAGGLLGSGDSFSGLFSYEGSYAYPLHGTLAGSFYGPHAEEIGATFNASGNGATLTGALTGQRSNVGSTSDGIQNLTLTEPVADELVYGGAVAHLFWKQDAGASTYRNLISVSESGGGGAITRSSVPEVSGDVTYVLNSADVVDDGRANFTTYKSTVAGEPITASLYKIGSSNTELALTYTTFSIWSSSNSSDPNGTTDFNNFYSVYGIVTPRELMGGRTGTASYAGVAYGGGVAQNGSEYDIGGTSHFDVNFSDSSYGGWLRLSGTKIGGGSRDFGQWNFTGDLGAGEFGTASLKGPGSYDSASQINPQFFGPSGQEVGASFSLGTGGSLDDSVSIAGIAVAKQQ